MSTAIVIPARWSSSRFPGKILFPILGKPLIRHVWERCLKARRADQVIIATDDMRIAEAAFDFGAEVSLTKADHPSGTDRVAEVASKLRGVSRIINVQGDEPAIDPKLIDKMIRALEQSPKLEMVTAACPFENSAEAGNPNNVKVVTGSDGCALYFSRSLIPFDRDGGSSGARYWWHIGVYGFQRNFLMKFVRWKPTLLEQLEKLEQLRALEHGAKIKVVPTESHGVGVDTLQDVARAEQVLQS